MRAISIGRMHRYLPVIVIAISLLAASPALADIHYLSASDLPAVLSASYTNDTIRLVGTRVSTPGDGISIQTHGVVLDLGGDTLEFGTGFGNGLYGVQINSYLDYNVTIRGGTILHGGGISGADTSRGCVCLKLQGSSGLLVSGTNMIIRGVDSRCIGSTNYQGNKNVEIVGGRYRSEGIGYYSRDLFRSAIMLLDAPSHSLIGADYNWKIHDLVIENSIHAAIRCEGLTFIYGCSITVDARNDLYEYPQSEWAHGSANSGGISGSDWAAGSRIHDNVILADSNYSGFDVGIMMESADGTASSPIHIYNNYIEGHRGLDAHYGYMNCKGMKYRARNKHVRIYNNTFKVKADGNPGTTFRGPTCAAMEVLSVAMSEIQLDSFVVIEDNYFEGFDVDGGSDEACGVRLEVQTGGIHTWSGAGNVWRRNHLKSNRTIYNMANQYDHGCGYFLATNDVAESFPTVYDFATFRLGRYEDRSVSNVFRDLTYLGHASGDGIVMVPGSDDADIRIECTAQIQVKGINNLPIDNAHVTVVDNYGNTVFTGYANEFGRATFPATYRYESNYSSDSTSFSPLQVTARYGEDFATSDLEISPEMASEITLVLDGTSGEEPQTFTGDLNVNGIAYEISDVVLYSAYFIYGMTVFQVNVPAQVAASDVNADGITLSVADLVYMVRIIIGDAEAKQQYVAQEKI